LECSPGLSSLIQWNPFSPAAPPPAARNAPRHGQGAAEVGGGAVFAMRRLGPCGGGCRGGGADDGGDDSYNGNKSNRGDGGWNDGEVDATARKANSKSTEQPSYN
jgi:hypothetical protein